MYRQEGEHKSWLYNAARCLHRAAVEAGDNLSRSRWVPDRSSGG